MRTTVTIPDDVFHDADDVARRRGMTRSQIYTEAIRRYLGSPRDESITEQINSVCDENSTALDPALLLLQARSLEKIPWQ